MYIGRNAQNLKKWLRGPYIIDHQVNFTIVIHPKPTAVKHGANDDDCVRADK